jgi:hypothetical protein
MCIEDNLRFRTANTLDQRSSPMRPYTLTLRSRDRVAGTPNNYTLRLPRITEGFYKASFQCLTDSNELVELRVKWGGTVSALSSASAPQMATVCVCSIEDSSGVLFIESPQQQVDIAYYTISTDQLATAMTDHVISVVLEPIN